MGWTNMSRWTIGKADGSLSGEARCKIPIVKPGCRIAAALLLVLMLPVQGWAAACAQICARVDAVHRAAVMMQAPDRHAQRDAAPAGDAPNHEHCGDSEMGAGKCCQGHTFVIQLSVNPVVVA